MVRREVARALSILAALAALAASRGVAADPVARLVLVVGNNRPAEPGQSALRYADDDAIRYFERFEGLAALRLVLTRLDDDSRSYRSIYPELPPPTRAALERAMRSLRARATELKAQGRFVEIVFVFAGHGGWQEGESYLALEDARLRPGDLEALLLRGSPADLVHVIVDACSAAGLVEGRGPMVGRREPLSEDLLAFGGLAARHPRAGFVLAAATDGRAYEWSRFHAGVASHLIRSALGGAADRAPPDGRVTYDEIEGFLVAATEPVLPSEFRQQITVVPPRALPSAAIVDLRDAPSASVLRIDRPGRYHLTDADGHRVADLHHGRGVAEILLPAYSPRFALTRTARRDGCSGPGRLQRSACSREEIVHEIESRPGTIVLGELPAAEPTAASRGVIEDSVLEQILARPWEGETPLRTRLRAEATAGDSPQTTPATLSVGYRATFGSVQEELTLLHAGEVRLELPVGARFLLAPAVALGRGTAAPERADEYPVYDLEAGADLLFAFPLSSLGLGIGLEARYQLFDQILPGEPERLSSLGLAGATIRARLGLVARLGLAISVSAGGRVGSVEDRARVRPYAAIGIAVGRDL